MKLSKKIFIYLMVGFFAFSSVSITYYKSVHAFEWIEVGISTTEALKWLLGAMGIISTAGAATDNFWNGYEEEFYEYATEDNIVGLDVRAWLEKLAKGTLDKSSEVWDCFKSWCSDLVSNNSSGGGSSGSATLQEIFNNLGVTSYSNQFNNYLNASFNFGYYFASGSNTMVIIYNTSYPPTVNGTGWPNGYTYHYKAGDYWIRFEVTPSHQATNFYKETLNDDGSTPLSLTRGPYYVFGVDELVQNTSLWDVVSPVSGSLDTINDARQEQFDIINKNTGDEVEQEVHIPMPGVSSGDDSISQDSYDAIMDRVVAGEISIDDAVDDIQEIMQVIVYDTESDDVIPVSPDPDDPTENEKKDDVIKENKVNMGFTLAGLENVFPFCLPWDIYAFLNILDAEPVAPVFNIPFPNVDDPEHPLTTQVDLSSWDDAMRIVRLAQDFLFIIGLAFLTRSMIGAGGGD